MPNVWKYIMKEETKWTRNCPECGCVMYYRFYSGLYRANIKNSLCNVCAHTGTRNGFYKKTHSESVKKLMSEKKEGYIPWQHFKNPDEIKKKLSERFTGSNNPMFGKGGELNSFFGKKHTDASRTKIRLCRVNYISNAKFNGNQYYPSYNTSSIPILEAKAKELGITDLQHAENGGEFYIKELGYWVDGYSKEKNIVIEYDEKHHFKNGELC